jgi:hypothetical protein
VSKHTPGPWAVGYATTSLYVNDLEAEANARLIAAAPEMYDALRTIEEALSPDVTSAGDEQAVLDSLPERWRVALAAARAVLAKVQS